MSFDLSTVLSVVALLASFSATLLWSNNDLGDKLERKTEARVAKMIVRDSPQNEVRSHVQLERIQISVVDRLKSTDLSATSGNTVTS